MLTLTRNPQAMQQRQHQLQQSDACLPHLNLVQHSTLPMLGGVDHLNGA